MKANYHTHTVWCDGKDSVENVILSAIGELTDNDHFVKPAKKPPVCDNTPKTTALEQPPVSKEKTEAAKKIFLRVPDMSCNQYQKALNLVDIFEGTVQVIFYNTAENKYVSYSNGISLSPFVISELCNVLGEENVVIK